MRQITITLALTSENVHTLERKTEALNRNFKRFMVSYNVLYLLKIIADGAVDYLSQAVVNYFVWPIGRALAITLTILAYMCVFVDVTMVGYFINTVRRFY